MAEDLIARITEKMEWYPFNIEAKRRIAIAIKTKDEKFLKEILSPKTELPSLTKEIINT